MATTLDSVVSYIAPYVLGAPEPLIAQMLRLTCIDFCRRTDTVQRIQAPLDVVAGTQDYAVTVPTDMRLVRVLGAAWQGVWLTPVQPGDVRSDVALRGAAVGTAVPLSGGPRYFFQKALDATSVSLYPIPDTALTGGLLIKASFAPTTTALAVEDQLLTDWLDPIAAGAIARLQAMPRQEFSADSMPRARQYEMGVGAAKRTLITGRITDMGRVQPRRFA